MKEKTLFRIVLKASQYLERNNKIQPLTNLIKEEKKEGIQIRNKKEDIIICTDW